ncbi:catalase family peroxidase [Methyloferula stellata]|uniref:catalase family peroxidase n=1 Tax=Methyloferula stellata TaxID=876270 RepID=UPI00035E621D|nr:catalase family peroxidase [Methyloferula stellata]
MIKKIFPFALAALTVAAPAAAFADDDTVATQIVDTMNKVFGVHPGFRANHAKGLVTEGHFKASPDAAGLSKAAIFDGSSIPVTVRFSDSTGVPNIPDGSPNANPHGLSIKYHLPDGSETDMVINSLHFFPVASGEDFNAFLQAVGASPAGAPKPTKLDQFFESHPTAPKALATVHTPDSFADEIYYGIDAFIFTNKAGAKQAVRYQVVPEKITYLDEATAAKQAPDFLIDELPKRLAKGPVTFHLKAQLAAPGDPTNDASKPWPDDRKLVDLGVLTIEKAVPDSLTAQKALLFLPGQVIDGIDVSDDPLIGVRDGAYAVSFSRRSQ